MLQCDAHSDFITTELPIQEDIVRKLLDFIVAPHAYDDSTLSDDLGSNCRKRKQEGRNAAKNSEATHKISRKNLDDEQTSRKRQQKYSELESDEEGAKEGHEDDEHMKSGSEENKDDDEEADGEHEDGYDSRKVKASKKLVEGKGSAAKRKAITGRVSKTAHVATLSKCSSRVSSSLKGSKDKRSTVEDSNSRKSKPITPKLTSNSRKVTNERSSPDCCGASSLRGVPSTNKELVRGATVTRGGAAPPPCLTLELRPAAGSEAIPLAPPPFHPDGGGRLDRGGREREPVPEAPPAAHKELLCGATVGRDARGAAWEAGVEAERVHGEEEEEVKGSEHALRARGDEEEGEEEEEAPGVAIGDEAPREAGGGRR
ncbi:hypothetical protein C2845_PM01G35750 [Panicum miliaceum]|uniref:Uncharacterized protein n=1 Tax=Panicum miliaceum TaxID=4540 RepID=A0A3L6TI86_PANMI|nr:hypothetical protein C2845_PM01G35750 [Panicum miliaceum]